MKRAERSPIDAESVAFATSIDYVYWLRAVAIELLFGENDYRNSKSINPSHLSVPFAYETDQSRINPTVYPVMVSSDVVVGGSSEFNEMFPHRDHQRGSPRGSQRPHRPLNCFWFPTLKCGER